MSNNDKNPTPNVQSVTSLPEATDEAVKEAKVRFAKTKNFVRNHKETITGSFVLVGLVGAAAIAGRATAPKYDHVIAFEPVREPDYNVDITVNDETA